MAKFEWPSWRAELLAAKAVIAALRAYKASNKTAHQWNKLLDALNEYDKAIK